MKKLKLLFTMLIVLAAVGVQAQNTGSEPFVGSTHSYKVTKSATLTTALLWTVEGGVAADYELVDADKETVIVTWKKVGDFTLKLTESRTSGNGCPTTREFPVSVKDNNFDVIASIVGNATGCATVSNPVDDVNSNGNNSDDVFGATQRVYNVTMTGGDFHKDWSFEFSISGANSFDGYNVAVAGATEISGVYTVTGAAAAETASNVATITVTYNTNKQATNNGQDPDFDLKLTVTNAKDAANTLEAAGNVGNNIATYSIEAVPATTPIIVVD